MIALAGDYLLFQFSSGEKVPFSADMISVEVLGETGEMLDAELVRNAAKAVFYYFKHELRRDTATLAEFAEALEKVLHGFNVKTPRPLPRLSRAGVIEADLRQLASESGKGCELFFFPRLREELRSQLQHEPRELHFRGLRGCVKRLAGARRWSARCQKLEDQIVEFLRHCFTAEARPEQCALLVQ
jgi:hypothetical protein